MLECMVCKNTLTVARMECACCGLKMEGEFLLPRLARLSRPHRILAEQMLLSGGNLKDLATTIGISYPTLRRRMDELMHALNQLKQDDDLVIASLLTKIENGSIKPEEGIRKIKEIQGEI
jgi:hypothetical protein